MTTDVTALLTTVSSNSDVARIDGTQIIGLADGVLHVSVQLFGNVSAGFVSPVKVVVGGFVAVSNVTTEIFTGASWAAVGVIGLYDVAIPILTVQQASTYPIDYILSQYVILCMCRISMRKVKLLQWPHMHTLLMGPPKTFPTRQQLH